MVWSVLPITLASGLVAVDRLAELLARAGCPVAVAAEAGAEREVSDGILVHDLPTGVRQVPEHLAQWVARSATRLLVLISGEPLAQPAISLHRGRILLVDGAQSPERLVDLITERRPSTGDGRQQRIHAARWNLHIAADPGNELVTCFPGSDATVAIGTPPGTAQRERIREAMADPPSSRLGRLAENCGWSALIHLDVRAGEWLVVANAATPVHIAIGGRGRVPGAWMLRAETGLTLHRRLRAHPGDVVLATWGLPLPVLATLAPALEKGAGSVLGDYFRETGDGAAVAVEAR